MIPEKHSERFSSKKYYTAKFSSRKIQLPKVCPRCGSEDATELVIIPTSYRLFFARYYYEAQVFACKECAEVYQRGNAAQKRVKLSIILTLTVATFIIMFLGKTILGSYDHAKYVSLFIILIGLALSPWLVHQSIREIDGDVLVLRDFFRPSWVRCRKKEYLEKVIEENKDIFISRGTS